MDFYDSNKSNIDDGLADEWTEQSHDLQQISPSLESQTNSFVSHPLSAEERLKYNNQYSPPNISSHYVAAISKDMHKKSCRIKRAQNEAKLKRFYRIRNLLIYPVKKVQAGGVSGEDTSKSSLLSLDVDGSSNLNKATISNNRQGQQFSQWALRADDSGRVKIFNNLDGKVQKDIMDPMMSYLIYQEKVLTITRDTEDKLRRCTMWVPISDDIHDIDTSSIGESGNPIDSASVHKATCQPSTKFDSNIDDDFPSDSVFTGKINNISTFGDVRIPSLVYHSAVALKNKIYIFGGLQPSFDSNGVAPNLDDFHVDGIKNLPPPLNEKFINNPCMIPNKNLYVLSANSLTVRRPKLAGQIPPPLLCSKMTKLTDRYLFHYGGFQIWNQTIVDEESGQYYLRRKAFLNNYAYILDTYIFKFTEIKIYSQPNMLSSLAPTIARFGHVQQSLKLNNVNQIKSTEGDDNKSISSSTKTTLHSCSSSTDESCHNSLNSENKINCNLNSSNPQLYNIIIMGGYTQINDDEYKALDDLCRIDVKIESRGKKGYFKFCDTATAFFVSRKENINDIWPESRAFTSACIADTDSLNNSSLLDSLLTNLLKNQQSNLLLSKQHDLNLLGVPHYSLDHSKSIYPHNTDKTSKNSTMQHSIDKTLIIHGGSNINRVFGDMWSFDFDKLSWTQIHIYKRDPNTKEETRVSLPLVGHDLLKYKDKLLLFGGFHRYQIEKLYGHLEQPLSTPEETICTMNCTTGVIDLGKMILKGLKYNLKPEHFNKNLMLVASSIIYAEGHLYLICGANAPYDGNFEKLQLRTISELVLPLAETDIS